MKWGPALQAVIRPVLELENQCKHHEAWSTEVLSSKRPNPKGFLLQQQKQVQRGEGFFLKTQSRNDMILCPLQHILFKAEGLKKEMPRGCSYPLT